MNMLSFLGETPTIALRLAQEECGEEAIVISTKKISNAQQNGKDMSDLIVKLKNSIIQDIEDIKAAKHEQLLRRNDDKHILIDNITSLKSQLNSELISKMQDGVDVNIYRKSVDLLEIELKELYELNKRLASIVLPVQQMYKDLVSEITAVNGGKIFDIKA